MNAIVIGFPILILVVIQIGLEIEVWQPFGAEAFPDISSSVWPCCLQTPQGLDGSLAAPMEVFEMSSICQGIGLYKLYQAYRPNFLML